MEGDTELTDGIRRVVNAQAPRPLRPSRFNA